jgi:tRNA(His) guanylyltransferase
MAMGNLGDRMKEYERTFSNTALKRTPLMIRVDGRAFHTFTRGLYRPFDEWMISAMVQSALGVAMEMQGFKAAYVQSDEATFCLTDYDTNETQGWFGYKLQKIVSISSALMTAHFNNNFKTDRLPVFDSRAFNLPKEEVANAFLWRALDWKRNSLQMYCQSLFSHKQLHGKNQAAMHEMLHGIGKNWATDLGDQKKNGTFLIRGESGSILTRTDILPSYKDIDYELGHFFNAA